jgi:hypothetical protein
VAWPESIQQALRLPQGARFYRCALQVNPPHYASTYRGASRADEPGTFEADDQAQIEALVASAAANQIEVLGITDHNHAGSVEAFAAAAARHGIVVFPGFEARSKEGVHFLCLFPPGTRASQLARYLGEIGIHNEEPNDDCCKLSCDELPQFIAERGGIVIAAHITQANGLLTTLRGQPCINAWRNRHLLAAQIPGAIDGLPVNYRRIIENTDPAYAREHAPSERVALAVVNAQDVVDPDDFAKSSASCRIKMTEATIEGLRQAFLDPGSRIRLNGDAPEHVRAELVAMTWVGGFLDGVAIHFSEHLNVLIGGRGTGKSTIIESIRYVLDLPALGDGAALAHQGVVNDVLQPGTRVSLLVRAHHPAVSEYVIERTVPNTPVVRDSTGRVVSLDPSDILAGVEVYGQHEMSELTRSPEKLTRLLERFVDRYATTVTREADVARELSRLRAELIAAEEDLKDARERLEALPRYDETLKRYQAAGVEDRLKAKNLLLSEEQILKTADERLQAVRRSLTQFAKVVPIDRRFAAEEAIATLPGRDVLTDVWAALTDLETALSDAVNAARAATDSADARLKVVRGNWTERQAQIETDYQRVLRELQKERIDGTEFINIRRAIADLQPVAEEAESLKTRLADRRRERHELLVEWEELAAQSLRLLQQAAKRVNRQLAQLVRVTVTPAGQREPLFDLLRDEIGGQLRPALDRLRACDVLSPRQLADACRAGVDELEKQYKISGAAATRLAGATDEVLMRIEELTLPNTTQVELNVAGDGQEPLWRSLDHLSTGQKATAILFLLLLEADAPLIIDQPEDDLDNRFISEGIVPKMRDEKRRRQFILSTHNANIPVLGDAELIVALSTLSKDGESEVIAPADQMGSLDAAPVRELVERVLEGGRDAFEARRRKYGF